MSNSSDSTPFSMAELAQLQKSTQPKKMISPTPQIEAPTNAPSKEQVALILKTNKYGLEHYEESMGGRAGVIDCLSSATLDKKQQFFLELLLDPQRSKDSINKVAKEAGLTHAQGVEILKSTSFARSHALGMAKLHGALPAIADDIASKSKDAKIECPQCFGEQYLNGDLCSVCNGKGQIKRESTIDHQKLVLEATGVIKKSSGLNIQMNQNVGVMQPGSFFSKFVKESDAAAYTTDAIDAEIVDKEPSGEQG